MIKSIKKTKTYTAFKKYRLIIFNEFNKYVF